MYFYMKKSNFILKTMIYLKKYRFNLMKVMNMNKINVHIYFL